MAGSGYDESALQIRDGGSTIDQSRITNRMPTMDGSEVEQSQTAMAGSGFDKSQTSIPGFVIIERLPRGIPTDGSRLEASQITKRLPRGIPTDGSRLEPSQITKRVNLGLPTQSNLNTVPRQSTLQAFYRPIMPTIASRNTNSGIPTQSIFKSAPDSGPRWASELGKSPLVPQSSTGQIVRPTSLGDVGVCPPPGTAVIGTRVNQNLPINLGKRRKNVQHDHESKAPSTFGDKKYQRVASGAYLHSIIAEKYNAPNLASCSSEKCNPMLLLMHLTSPSQSYIYRMIL